MHVTSISSKRSQIQSQPVPLLGTKQAYKPRPNCSTAHTLPMICSSAAVSCTDYRGTDFALQSVTKCTHHCAFQNTICKSVWNRLIGHPVQSQPCVTLLSHKLPNFQFKSKSTLFFGMKVTVHLLHSLTGKQTHSQAWLLCPFQCKSDERSFSPSLLFFPLQPYGLISHLLVLLEGCSRSLLQ